MKTTTTTIIKMHVLKVHGVHQAKQRHQNLRARKAHGRVANDPIAHRSACSACYSNRNSMRQCPNIDDHRKWDSFRHTITRHTFLRLIQKQLGQDRDNDVEPWHVNGSRGMMFTVTLRSHGYTVAAKATTYPWVTDLRHEESVYNHLHELQGTHIPVCLGNIDLKKPCPYTARCILVHMMFLACR